LKSTITKYIENPMLLEGKKNSLKVFVLILSAKPMVCLFNEGYVKFAAKKFDLGKLKG